MSATKAVAAQKVATALVHYEVTQLTDAKRKVLTVDSIVKRYKLQLGTYEYPNRQSCDVAGQVIRNALNKEWRLGEVGRLVDADGKVKRSKRGGVQYVIWEKQAEKLKGRVEWCRR